MAKILAVNLRRVGAGLALVLLAPALSACVDDIAGSTQRPAFVRTEIVRPRVRQTSVTLTGEVQARFRADLAFRVSGRVVKRLVEVGAHVDAGQVLARLDPAEQQADLDAAAAAVTASESQLRVATATFERQRTLLSNGFTTRVVFDQAQEGLQSAEASLQDAKAQLGRAKNALGDTELRASAAGVITARKLEIGQVVDAGQSVFTLAQDGDRDAIFDVDERILLGDTERGEVALRLLSDSNVTALGRVREVSPAVDTKGSTVRVKVAIQNPAPAMPLGSAVAGTGKFRPVAQIILPWAALMAMGSKPAIWTVDPANNTASLKVVTIGGYEAGAVIIKEGLEPGERVVIDGGKLLSSGQLVTYDGDRS
jgi:membrane fusion protein, multidrug efflux system